jgi:site-specific recombinase
MLEQKTMGAGLSPYDHIAQIQRGGRGFVGIFVDGFWSAIAYSATFILIQLLHFTLATKQPAMTLTPAIELKDIDSRGGSTALYG